VGEAVEVGERLNPVAVRLDVGETLKFPTVGVAGDEREGGSVVVPVPPEGQEECVGV